MIKAGVHARREAVEAKFLALLETVAIAPRFFGTFRNMVIDAWKGQHEEAEELRRRRDQRVRALREQKARLLDALTRGTVSDQDYKARVTVLETEITAESAELIDATVDERQLQATLAYAEVILATPARAWLEMRLKPAPAVPAVGFPRRSQCRSEWNPRRGSVVAHLQLLAGADGRR